MTDTADVVSQSVQHRCPRMREHVQHHPHHLPIPCPDCYSLIVTAERIPYQPNVPWHDIPKE